MKKRIFNKRNYIEFLLFVLMSCFFLGFFIAQENLRMKITKDNYCKSNNYRIKSLNQMTDNFVLGTGKIGDKNYYYTLVERNEEGFAMETFEIPSKKSTQTEYSFSINSNLGENEEAYMKEIYRNDGECHENDRECHENDSFKPILEEIILYVPSNYIEKEIIK